MTIFEDHPDVECYACTLGSHPVYLAHLKDKSVRSMTDLEIKLLLYPPDRSIDTLSDLNSAEAGAPLCEKCEQFHPDLQPAPVMTMYAEGEQPQPILCPSCVKEWVEMWQERWDEYYSGLF